MLGDLNCDTLKAHNESNTPTKRIKSLYELYQLSQLIDEPTRITMTTSSLIDHIVTNTPENISDSDVIHTGISDHSLIFAIRKISVLKTQENTVEIRSMKNFDDKKFSAELLKQRWEHLYFFADNPNTMWEMWKTMFLEVLDKHAPLQHKKIRSKKVPWITSNIKELIIQRDKLERKAILTNLENDRSNYKTSRNEVNTKLRDAKRNYYSTTIAGQKFNPKRAWKSINSLLGKQKKPTLVNELSLNENCLTSSKSIAEGFNNYFSNIGPELASKIDSSNCNFEIYVKNAKLEFTAFKPVVVSHVCRLLYMAFQAIKPLALTKFLLKLLK